MLRFACISKNHEQESAIVFGERKLRVHSHSHSSIQTTERYLGSERDIEIAVNDNMGL